MRAASASFFGAALLVTSSLLSLASCTAPRGDRPGDILLITVDTLRADHLGLYGYPRATSPNLDRWFEGGAVFERAYSTEANTPQSVISILSGLLPQEHGVRLFYQLVPDRTQLISDLLPPAYQTAAFVSNLSLTDEATGLAHRFDHFDDFVDEGDVFYERNARRTTDAVLLWLRKARSSERPLFLWVHYIDPHGPYHPPQDWQRSFKHGKPALVSAERVPRANRPTAVLQTGERADGLLAVDAYDEEIAFTDLQVGRLLDGYAALAAVDEALVIFTADHGESMMEHEIWFAHGYHVYEEIIRVPLMLRGPRLEHGRRAELASGVDVLPTVLAFAGNRVPASLSGRDLRRRSPIARERVVFAEATWQRRQWRAAIWGQGKWLIRVSRRTGRVTGSRYYDLQTDPHELEPQSWNGGSPVAERLLELSRTDPDPGGIPSRYARGLRRGAPKVAPRATDEQLERLRHLGYVE